MISDSQISVSSVWEWSRHGDKPSLWAPSGARLKKPGLPWAAASSDTKQWVQVDLKKKKRVTGERKKERMVSKPEVMMLKTCSLSYAGIITTGSALHDYQFHVSAYRVQYSTDGQDWTAYQEAGSNQDKVYESVCVFKFCTKCREFTDCVFQQIALSALALH